jgi:hypothetical protein
MDPKYRDNKNLPWAQRKEAATNALLPTMRAIVDKVRVAVVEDAMSILCQTRGEFCANDPMRKVALDEAKRNGVQAAAPPGQPNSEPPVKAATPPQAPPPAKEVKEAKVTPPLAAEPAKQERAPTRIYVSASPAAAERAPPPLPQKVVEATRPIPLPKARPTLASPPLPLRVASAGETTLDAQRLALEAARKGTLPPAKHLPESLHLPVQQVNLRARPPAMVPAVYPQATGPVAAPPPQRDDIPRPPLGIPTR